MNKRKKSQGSEIKITNKDQEVIFSQTVKHQVRLVEVLILFLVGAFLGTIILFGLAFFSFEKRYRNRIYPGVKVDGVDFGNQTKVSIQNYYLQQGTKFSNLLFNFTFQKNSSTISAKQLRLSYDTKFISEQAFSLGRSGHPISDLYIKIKSLKGGIDLKPILTLDEKVLNSFLSSLQKEVDLPAQDALFNFEAGRVAAFRTSQNGQRLNLETTKKTLYQKLANLPSETTAKSLEIPITIETVLPKITTAEANNLGIQELIGQGTSTYYHSIANRVFNIDLATSRINGILIPPGAVFSFNEAVGDISSLTGYKQAFVIKEGKTVLGDGGGICQVSTTLFRAALNSGLPILERWPHSYRVGYYEQDQPPGLDATVFAPSNDLKIKNDTDHHLLIQATADTLNYRLTFNLYGKKDSRSIFLTKPKVWDQSVPPPDLYQDDPTLPKNTIRQIDFSAYGAKSSFDYKVEKAGKVIFEKTFFSSYQPWQAVYLRGMKE